MSGLGSLGLLASVASDSACAMQRRRAFQQSGVESPGPSARRAAGGLAKGSGR